MFKRFFAFGCSYTNYLWPTWADIIADDLEIEYHNFGQPGLGNVGIQAEVIRADLEHNFSKDDLIIIMWSHWNREDRFLSGRWEARGNIFTNNYYDRKFIKKYWSFNNDIIKNSTAIISINKAYGDLIKFQSHILPPGDFEYEIGFGNKNKNHLFKFYSPFLPKKVFNTTEKYLFDTHPSIQCYLDNVEYAIYPHCNLKLKSKTTQKYKEIDQIIKNIDNAKMKPKKKYDLILDSVKNFNANNKK